MVTHWIVEIGEPKSRLKVSMATLTIVVSRTDMNEPMMTTVAKRRIRGSSRGFSKVTAASWPSDGIGPP